MTEDRSPGRDDRQGKKRPVEEGNEPKQVIEVVRTVRSDGTVFVETPKKNT